MLATRPAVARYVHEAHAITRLQLEALEAAAACVLRGSFDDACARLATAPKSRGRDHTTPLDVVAVAASRAQAIEALRGTPHAVAIPAIEALSLAPRDVSDWAETVFVRRTARLRRLLELEAPESIIATEIELLEGAMRRLDSLEPSVDEAESGFLPDDEIRCFSDTRFDLSLGSLTAVVDAVADFHRERRPADGSEVLALGGPLLEIDFSAPPQALLERALEARGVWDEGEERASAAQQPHGPWLDWMVVDDASNIPALRDVLRALRADALEVPPEVRTDFASSIEPDFAPFITCEDWIPVLDSRLAGIEDDFVRALESGLVVLSRVQRDSSF